MITININKFRSIDHADIQLNGITVVAGENGSGKSTLSRLLYHTIKISQEYEHLVRENIKDEFRDIVSVLRTIVREIQYLQPQDRQKLIRVAQLNLHIREKEDLMDYYNRLTAYIDNIHDNIVSQNDHQSNENNIAEDNSLSYKYVTVRNNRYIKLLSTLIGDNENSTNIDEICSKLKAKILSNINNAINQIEYRPINIFKEKIASIFIQKMDDAEFSLNELDIPITDWDNRTLRSSNIIHNSIYIDTPMAIGYHLEVGDGYGYWNDLVYILKNSKPKFNNSTEEEDILQKISGDNIVSGHVSYEEDVVREGFIYKRNDDQVFDLEECATGIKSFGILQMLLQNGMLTKNTLLIIDEPEAHLHPQWIVEYARIIVLLNKHIGVRFFIASHNPDMVSAIKYIAEKEGLLDSVSYYLANKSQAYLYKYEPLGVDIDPIFGSFNIAIDRINQYAQIDQ